MGNTGRVTSITNPNGQSTVYTYQDSATTGEPRLSEIKNLNASAAVISKFDYIYDAQGQITTWTQQTATNNPAKYALKYDAGGRLLNANVTDTVTGAVLHDYDYIYDALGNRLSEQVDGNVTGASINRLNQLIGQTAGGKMTFTGTLSRPSSVTINGAAANADTSSFSGTANVTAGTNTVAIVANDFNGQVTTNRYQVVVPPSSASYTYDVNGNLTDDGTRTYQWDAKNELTAIIYKVGSGDPNAGNHTDFTYNGSGQRVKIVERTGTAAGSGTVISIKQYVFNEERDANNLTTKRYFSQGEQRVVGGVTTNYFYTRDHLGSIREMLDTGGNIKVRYSYDPYGRRSKVSGALDCDYGFTGHYYHVTSGYYLAVARAYDPNAGRWISRDPSGEGSGLNLYAYCGGNPINFVDVLGMDRTYYDRGSQLIGGIGALSLGYYMMVTGAAAVTAASLSTPVSGPVGGAGAVGGAVVGLTGAMAILYGLLNVAGAVAPSNARNDKLAKTIQNLPASIPEALARLALGQNGQDVAGILNSGKDALTAEKLLERITNFIDMENKANSVEGGDFPSRTGNPGGCMDNMFFDHTTPFMTTPYLGPEQS